MCLSIWQINGLWFSSARNRRGCSYPVPPYSFSMHPHSLLPTRFEFRLMFLGVRRTNPYSNPHYFDWMFHVILLRLCRRHLAPATSIRPKVPFIALLQSSHCHILNIHADHTLSTVIKLIYILPSILSVSDISFAQSSLLYCHRLFSESDLSIRVVITPLPSHFVVYTLIPTQRILIA